MAKLPGLTEYYATLGAPAINFGRGLLGYQDPVGTETMQNRMTEIEDGRTKGNVGYDEYGLVPSAGRFTGGLMDLAVNNPADFALAGSVGKYDFSPEGRTGLNYDFTPDQDTGSTGSAMLDYVNSGGVRNSLSNLKNSFSNMGSAQAAEIAQPQNLGFRSMVDMNNDVQNFDSQFVSPDRFNNMGQMGPVKSNMNAPAALDMERFAGVSNLGRNDMDVEQVEQLGSPSRFQGFKNKIGSGLNSLRDFAMNKGNIGRNLIGSAGAMAMGLPGIVGSGAMSLLGGLGNMFEDRQLTGDIEDEYGNMYSADELNSQNALGGYYTDPARSARRRTSRIAKMRQRLADKKKVRSNFDRLVKQEKAQQLRDAKNAADRANIQNIQNYTGQELSGYRMSRPASERNYTGGGPQANDPIGGFENKSGMGRTGYEEGGLASMFTRRR